MSKKNVGTKSVREGGCFLNTKKFEKYVNSIGKREQRELGVVYTRLRQLLARIRAWKLVDVWVTAAGEVSASIVYHFGHVITAVCVPTFCLEKTGH